MPGSPDGDEIDKVSEQDGKQESSEASAEAKGEEEQSTLDAVTSVLEGSKEESPASDKPDPNAADEEAEGSQADDEEKSEGDDAEDDSEDGFSKDELAQLHSRTRKRIKELAGQAKELTAENDTLKPKAESFDKIIQFAQQNRLTQEDVNNTFQIASLVRNDPVKALEQLEPIVQQLREATGRKLSPDLEQKVRQGYMTREAAEELSTARANDRLSREREQRFSQEREQQDQQRQSQEALGQAASAADDWYAEQQGKDPDFKLKQTRIAEKAELALVRLRKVPTPAETRTMLDGIKKDVDKEFRKFTPRRQPVDEPVDGTASSGKKPAPESTLDVVNTVLAG